MERKKFELRFWLKKNKNSSTQLWLMLMTGLDKLRTIQNYARQIQIRTSRLDLWPTKMLQSKRLSGDWSFVLKFVYSMDFFLRSKPSRTCPGTYMIKFFTIKTDSAQISLFEVFGRKAINHTSLRAQMWQYLQSIQKFLIKSIPLKTNHSNAEAKSTA